MLTYKAILGPHPCCQQKPSGSPLAAGHGVVDPGAAYLDQELWGGIGGHNSTGHFRAHSVQLLNLPLPDLSKAPASAVHLRPASPVTLRAEGEISLISEFPADSRDEEIWLLSCTCPLTGILNSSLQGP